MPSSRMRAMGSLSLAIELVAFLPLSSSDVETAGAGRFLGLLALRVVLLDAVLSCAAAGFSPQKISSAMRAVKIICLNFGSLRQVALLGADMDAGLMLLS